MGLHRLVKQGREHVEGLDLRRPEPCPRSRPTNALGDGQIFDLGSLERDPKSDESDTEHQPAAPKASTTSIRTTTETAPTVAESPEKEDDLDYLFEDDVSAENEDSQKSTPEISIENSAVEARVPVHWTLNFQPTVLRPNVPIPAHCKRNEDDKQTTVETIDEEAAKVDLAFAETPSDVEDSDSDAREADAKVIPQTRAERIAAAQARLKAKKLAINGKAAQPKQPRQETASATTIAEYRAQSSGPQKPAPKKSQQSKKRKAGDISTDPLPMVAPEHGLKKPRGAKQKQSAELEATVAQIQARDTENDFDAPGQIDEEYLPPKRGDFREASLPHLPAFGPKRMRTADESKVTTSKRAKMDSVMTKTSEQQSSASTSPPSIIDLTDTSASAATTPATSFTSLTSSTPSVQTAQSSSPSMPTDDDTHSLHERVIQRYTKNRGMEMPTFQERLDLMTVKQRDVEEKKMSNMTDAMRARHIREKDENYRRQWERYVAQFSGMTEEVALMRDNDEKGKAAREAYLKERDEKKLREESLKIARAEKKARREEERAQKAREKEERQRGLAAADHDMPEQLVAAPQLAQTMASNPYLQSVAQQQMVYTCAGMQQPIPMVPSRPHTHPAPQQQMAYAYPGRPQILPYQPYQPYQHNISTMPPPIPPCTYQQPMMTYSNGHQQHPQQQHGPQYGCVP